MGNLPLVQMAVQLLSLRLQGRSGQSGLLGLVGRYRLLALHSQDPLLARYHREPPVFPVFLVGLRILLGLRTLLGRYFL